MAPIIGINWLDIMTPLLSEINTLRPKQHGRHFADDTFKRIFLNEIVGISIKISLKFVHKGPFNNFPALVEIMAWCRPGDKPLSEPMVGCLLTHICVTRPQWVNWTSIEFMASLSNHIQLWYIIIHTSMPSFICYFPMHTFFTVKLYQQPRLLKNPTAD